MQKSKVVYVLVGSFDTQFNISITRMVDGQAVDRTYTRSRCTVKGWPDKARELAWSAQLNRMRPTSVTLGACTFVHYRVHVKQD